MKQSGAVGLLGKILLLLLGIDSLDGRISRRGRVLKPTRCLNGQVCAKSSHYPSIRNLWEIYVDESIILLSLTLLFPGILRSFGPFGEIIPLFCRRKSASLADDDKKEVNLLYGTSQPENPGGIESRICTLLRLLFLLSRFCSGLLLALSICMLGHLRSAYAVPYHTCNPMHK
jgi:hypothetical protein